MKLDVRTAIVLRHPNKKQALLLQRSPTKKLFPNLITGIGGKVELADGEGDDLLASALREFQEETAIPMAQVEELQLRLSTIMTRGDLQVILLWLTGQLTQVPTDLSCTEGQLAFYPMDQLPLVEMVPTAREPISFILQLDEKDETVYNGWFDKNERLTVNG